MESKSPCNEADAVRSARLYGKKRTIKIKYITRKTAAIVILEIILHIAGTK